MKEDVREQSTEKVDLREKTQQYWRKLHYLYFIIYTLHLIMLGRLNQEGCDKLEKTSDKHILVKKKNI